MPRPVGKWRKPIAERFWPKVRKSDGCWVWTGTRSPEGYGRLSSERGRPPLYAHRVSWEIHYGPIPEGYGVHHHCDNRPCVRPKHLFCSPHADNMRDMMAKGRGDGQFQPGYILAPRPRKYERYADAGQHRGMVAVICDGCGQETWQRRDHARRSERHYCNRACQAR
jgi:hypothetical protein